MSANYAGTLFVLLIIPSYPFPFSPLAVSSHPRTSVPLFLRFFRFHSPYHPVSAAFFSHRRSLIRLTGADERDSPSIRSDLVTFARHRPLISSVVRLIFSQRHDDATRRHSPTVSSLANFPPLIAIARADRNDTRSFRLLSR